MIFEMITVALSPSPEQAAMIDRTIACCGMLWNRMISDEAKLQEEFGRRFVPTPAKYKRELPELKDADSVALGGLHHRLVRQFQDHDYNPHDYPKPMPVSQVNSYVTYSKLSKRGFLIRFEDGGIRLPKLGLVPVKQERKLPECDAILSATVLRENGKYYCKVKYEAPVGQSSDAAEKQPA